MSNLFGLIRDTTRNHKRSILFGCVLAVIILITIANRWGGFLVGSGANGQPDPVSAEPPTPAPSVASRPLDRAIHNALLLPYAGVFDNLTFETDGSIPATVRLTGHVTRPTLKTDAERAVNALPSVSSVVNEIEVLPLSSRDDGIRKAVYQSIYGQIPFSRYVQEAEPPIHIIVKNGHVTLEGVVANEGGKNMAGNQAKSASYYVSNNLKVAGN